MVLPLPLLGRLPSLLGRSELAWHPGSSWPGRHSPFGYAWLPPEPSPVVFVGMLVVFGLPGSLPTVFAVGSLLIELGPAFGGVCCFVLILHVLVEELLALDGLKNTFRRLYLPGVGFSAASRLESTLDDVLRRRLPTA